jgi:hypothetical protein
LQQPGVDAPPYGKLTNSFVKGQIRPIRCGQKSISALLATNRHMHLDLCTGCADPFHWAVTMDGTGPAKNGSGLLKARQHFLLQLRSGLQQSSVPIALQQVSMSQRFRSVNSFATKVSSLLDKGAEHQYAPVAGADR